MGIPEHRSNKKANIGGVRGPQRHGRGGHKGEVNTPSLNVREVELVARVTRVCGSRG